MRCLYPLLILINLYFGMEDKNWEEEFKTQAVEIIKRVK